MGKSRQKALQRKDSYYKKAKAAGYRSRAAYKLLQLNRKHNFLQSARVCIDLCAAPGSWMQVSSKLMPVSSVIIGVDLYPIPNIPNTLSIQGDITTEKVRQEIKTNLKTWKADVVLHDGAPNVGKNWMHDSYQQNLLVLHSFKLACEFLQKGGTYVTKVFRSRDHLSLQYVFRKLFQRVEVTKPLASRFESAEIFIVCLKYLAPDKIDPQFFDPKYVFQSCESEPKNAINILKPEKSKKKAEGYEEGITMLFKRKMISEFIAASNHADILEDANEFEWDLPEAKASAHTTNEIIEFCKDIKVLGRKELRTLINWAKAVKVEINEEIKKRQPEIKVVETPAIVEEVDQDLEELQQIQEQIEKLKSDKEREDKQHRKKVDKKKKKLEEKLKLRLMVPGDAGPQEIGRDGLFTLETLDRAPTGSLSAIVDQSGDAVVESDSELSEDGGKSVEYYSKYGTYLDSTGTYHKTADDSDTDKETDEETSSDEEGLNLEKEVAREKKKTKRVSFAEDVPNDDEPDDDTNKTNPLLTDLVGDKVLDRRERKAENWFSNEIFNSLETDEIEDYELERAIKKNVEYGVTVTVKDIDGEIGATEGSQAKKVVKKPKPVNDKFNAKDAPASDSDSDSGVDSEEENEEEMVTEDKENDTSKPLKRKKGPQLSSLGLALATKMIRSKKSKRDLYDEGWNRYMWGYEELPDWFAKSERLHNSAKVEVEQEDLKMYENQNKAVDARTIKKVVEAKARKKRRLKKRMTKVRKKAELVTNNIDMTTREKATELKKIYKKFATGAKPKNKKYIVMKKCFGGRRPKSAKGPTKMVDPRQKKDKRAEERKQKRGKGKGKGRRK